MGKFTGKPVLIKNPIQTVPGSSAVLTHEGGSGYLRDPKSELFLLAVSNFVGENTFYESKTDRDTRFLSLIHEVTQSDPDWVARMIPWLRNTAQMRSATIVALVEYVRAGGPNGRALISSTLSRADEPAELLAYYLSVYGTSIPAAIKRGVADAANRLFTESNYLKYGSKKGWGFDRVINLAHPKPKAEWQSALYSYILNKRYDGSLEGVDMSLLPVISKNIELRDLSSESRKKLLETPGALAEAGMTWESASEFFGKMDAAVWESLIPQMGYMALLRNLRNFTEAGISKKSRDFVIAKLTDPDEVKRSRQFPLRFFSAYTQTGDEWTTAIAEGLDLSVSNVPELRGSSLILVDRSGSMDGRLSEKGSMARWQVASLFGLALAKKNVGRVDLFSYDNGHERVVVSPSTSILRTMDGGEFHPRGGTNTWRTVQAAYTGQDRVIILTDEQAHDRSAYASNITVPIFTFNVAGYKQAHVESGSNRYTFGGGLTDQAFTLLSILEERKNGEWPF